MKKGSILAFALLAAALSQTAGAITATKEYVDRKNTEIRTTTYTKAETDAKIVELAPRTSLEPATNYTDNAVEIAYHDAVDYIDRVARRIEPKILTTNDVCAIATNVVPEYTTHDTWICNNPIGQYWAPIWNGTGWYVSILDRTFPSDATTFTIIDAESPEPGFGDFIFTRVPASTRNALGLARLSEIPSTNGFISAATATNIAESVVNATVTGVVRSVSFKVKDYIFDPVTEICWRRQMVNGFLDYIAVTNIDVTLPENYEALEALERRDNQ